MSQARHDGVRNRLLKALTAADFAHLQPHLLLAELPLGEVLITPDQPVEHLYFLESGISSITAAGSNGRVEVGIIGREGLAGAVPVLLGSDRVPHDQFMQLAGIGWRIPAAAMSEACAASPSLQRLLLRYVQTEMVQVRQTAYVNATYTIETRLARWLLMCLDRADGNELPIKHEFLSMMLGVQRSGVTLALQNLEGGRCIRGRRGRITVLDRELLRTVADGSYGQAEAEYARLIEGR
ncbi:MULTISPECIES: Crp/Fnr family transcriptional regulator [unclassified Methylobacterium]|uniref:Crp/Fnr family transcriptional regulator n=1 Tax=unclassified Methylobacterium TaxID=2615210 RepID=UPI002269D564